MLKHLTPKDVKIVEIDLSKLDHHKKMDKVTYKKGLDKYQKRQMSLQRKIVDENLSVLLAFEGVDAAGKRWSY